MGQGPITGHTARWFCARFWEGLSMCQSCATVALKGSLAALALIPKCSRVGAGSHLHGPVPAPCPVPLVPWLILRPLLQPSQCTWAGAGQESRCHDVSRTHPLHPGHCIWGSPSTPSLPASWRELLLSDRCLTPAEARVHLVPCGCTQRAECPISPLLTHLVS